MSFLIAMAGKGGTGKTTTAGLLLRYLVEHGKTPVLAVDADANSNFNEVLGLQVEMTVGQAREEMKKGGGLVDITKDQLIEMRINQCLVETDGLAAQGHQVTAIDISPVAIAKVQQFAAERGLKINASVQDIAHYVFDAEYDGIVSTGVLHMFERNDWQLLLKNFQAHTTPGGYHAIGVLTDALPRSRRPERTFHRTVQSRGIIRSLLRLGNHLPAQLPIS